MANRGARQGAARLAKFQEAEEADVPSVCAVCLGPNKYVSMSKTHKGAACRQCSRPFTVFTWRVSVDAKVRKTMICQQCAAEKNACQSCFCDLATGLSLAAKEAMTPAELGAYTSRKTQRIEETGDDSCLMTDRRKRQRFEEKVCSFFQKGFCARGAKCQYRHVLPDDEEKRREGEEQEEEGNAEEEQTEGEGGTSRSLSPGRGRDQQGGEDTDTHSPAGLGADEKQNPPTVVSEPKTAAPPSAMLKFLKKKKI